MLIWNGYEKGINLGGWLSQCPYEKRHYDTFIIEEDIKKIASWGLDHVRLPIDYEVIQEASGEWIESGFMYIDSLIEWCRKYGLNVILDVHKTAGYAFYNLSTNTLFDRTELQSRFIALWETLAHRYAHFGEHIAFELLNEIVEENSLRWNVLAKRTIEAIRHIAPSIKIVIGGIQWNSVHTLDLLDEPFDENIVYTFHFYEPFLFTHQRAPWISQLPQQQVMDYPGELAHYRQLSKSINGFGSGLFADIDKMGPIFMEKLMQQAIDVATERHVRLYCGEYGVIDRAPLKSTMNWYADIHQVFEKYHIGRAAWTYKGKDFGLSDSHYRPILEAIIPSL